jgi:hypothetical protein
MPVPPVWPRDNPDQPWSIRGRAATLYIPLAAAMFNVYGDFPRDQVRYIQELTASLVHFMQSESEAKMKGPRQETDAEMKGPRQETDAEVMKLMRELIDLFNFTFEDIADEIQRAVSLTTLSGDYKTAQVQLMSLMGSLVRTYRQRKEQTEALITAWKNNSKHVAYLNAFRAALAAAEKYYTERTKAAFEEAAQVAKLAKELAANLSRAIEDTKQSLDPNVPADQLESARQRIRQGLDRIASLPIQDALVQLEAAYERTRDAATGDGISLGEVFLHTGEDDIDAAVKALSRAAEMGVFNAVSESKKRWDTATEKAREARIKAEQKSEKQIADLTQQLRMLKDSSTAKAQTAASLTEQEKTTLKSAHQAELARRDDSHKAALDRRDAQHREEMNQLRNTHRAELADQQRKYAAEIETTRQNAANDKSRRDEEHRAALAALQKVIDDARVQQGVELANAKLKHDHAMETEQAMAQFRARAAEAKHREEFVRVDTEYRESTKKQTEMVKSLHYDNYELKKRVQELEAAAVAPENYPSAGAYKALRRQLFEWWSVTAKALAAALASQNIPLNLTLPEPMSRLDGYETRRVPSPPPIHVIEPRYIHTDSDELRPDLRPPPDPVRPIEVDEKEHLATERGVQRDPTANVADTFSRLSVSPASSTTTQLVPSSLAIPPPSIPLSVSAVSPGPVPFGQPRVSEVSQDPFNAFSTSTPAHSIPPGVSAVSPAPAASFPLGVSASLPTASNSAGPAPMQTEQTKAHDSAGPSSGPDPWEAKGTNNTLLAPHGSAAAAPPAGDSSTELPLDYSRLDEQLAVLEANAKAMLQVFKRQMFHTESAEFAKLGSQELSEDAVASEAQARQIETAARNLFSRVTGQLDRLAADLRRLFSNLNVHIAEFNSTKHLQQVKERLQREQDKFKEEKENSEKAKLTNWTFLLDKVKAGFESIGLQIRENPRDYTETIGSIGDAFELVRQRQEDALFKQENAEFIRLRQFLGDNYASDYHAEQDKPPKDVVDFVVSQLKKALQLGKESTRTAMEIVRMQQGSDAKESAVAVGVPTVRTSVAPLRGGVANGIKPRSAVPQSLLLGKGSDSRYARFMRFCHFVAGNLVSGELTVIVRQEALVLEEAAAIVVDEALHSQGRTEELLRRMLPVITGRPDDSKELSNAQPSAVEMQRRIERRLTEHLASLIHEFNTSQSLEDAMHAVLTPTGIAGIAHSWDNIRSSADSPFADATLWELVLDEIGEAARMFAMLCAKHIQVNQVLSAGTSPDAPAKALPEWLARVLFTEQHDLVTVLIHKFIRSGNGWIRR